MRDRRFIKPMIGWAAQKHKEIRIWEKYRPDFDRELTDASFTKEDKKWFNEYFNRLIESQYVAEHPALLNGNAVTEEGKSFGLNWHDAGALATGVLTLATLAYFLGNGIGIAHGEKSYGKETKAVASQAYNISDKETQAIMYKIVSKQLNASKALKEKFKGPAGNISVNAVGHHSNTGQSLAKDISILGKAAYIPRTGFYDPYNDFSASENRSIQDIVDGDKNFEKQYPGDYPVNYNFDDGMVYRDIRINLNKSLKKHSDNKRETLYGGYSLGQAYEFILNDTADGPSIRHLLCQLRGPGPMDSDKLVQSYVRFIQKAITSKVTGRMPNYSYGVLYDRVGDCDDKSLLLVKGLRELGYGTCLFKFYSESLNKAHLMAGIQVPKGTGKFGTDYAPIEATGLCAIGYTDVTFGSGEDEHKLDIYGTPEIMCIRSGKVFKGRLA